MSVYHELKTFDAGHVDLMLHAHGADLLTALLIARARLEVVLVELDAEIVNAQDDSALSWSSRPELGTEEHRDKDPGGVLANQTGPSRASIARATGKA